MNPKPLPHFVVLCRFSTSWWVFAHIPSGPDSIIFRTDEFRPRFRRRPRSVGAAVVVLEGNWCIPRVRRAYRPTMGEDRGIAGPSSSAQHAQLGVRLCLGTG